MQISRAILPLDSIGRIEKEFILRESDSPSQFHHLTRVLRVKNGWKLELLDESSRRKILTSIKECSATELNLTIESQNSAELKYPLWLVLGLPEFDVLENVIEKITEIQLSGIKIFIPQHTQHKDALNRLNSKFLRLEKIRNAARIQSGSGPLTIEIFSDLKNVLSSINSTTRHPQIRFIASLQPDAANLQEFLHKNYPLEPLAKNTDIILVVGPEGDLSFEEYKQCGDAGFKPISLGHSVLRVETAAIGSAFSIFNYFNP